MLGILAIPVNCKGQIRLGRGNFFKIFLLALLYCHGTGVTPSMNSKISQKPLHVSRPNVMGRSLSIFSFKIFFVFVITWDPMGAKIVKCYSYSIYPI